MTTTLTTTTTTLTSTTTTMTTTTTGTTTTMTTTLTAPICAWCRHGIASGKGASDVCCALSCGACNRTSCASRPPDVPSSQCCYDEITYNGVVCKQSSDVGCVLPTTKAATNYSATNSGVTEACPTA